MLYDADSSRTTSYGARSLGLAKQTGRGRVRDKRIHRKSAPRPGHAKDESKFPPGFGEDGGETTPCNGSANPFGVAGESPHVIQGTDHLHTLSALIYKDSDKKTRGGA